MTTSDQKLAMLLLDLPGRVQPAPSAGKVVYGDLLQRVGKMRQFDAGVELDPPAAAVPAPFSLLPVIRRRRR